MIELPDPLAESIKKEPLIWNCWVPDALSSPLAPERLVEAYNRWQPDHLKIRRNHG